MKSQVEKTILTKQSMPETMYRASRCCRVLGNPMAYLILKCLGQGKKTPADIGRAIGARISTVSMTLRTLRQVDFVRYETDGASRLYWVKAREILGVMKAMEAWVDRMRVLKS